MLQTFLSDGIAQIKRKTAGPRWWSKLKPPQFACSSSSMDGIAVEEHNELPN
jgi:hypothetical protein